MNASYVPSSVPAFENTEVNEANWFILSDCILGPVC